MRALLAAHGVHAAAPAAARLAFFARTLAGNGSYGAADGVGTAATFTTLTGVTVGTSGDVFVSDGAACLIRAISPAGTVSTVAGCEHPVYNCYDLVGVGTNACISSPQGVAAGEGGLIFFATPQLVRVISPAGMVSNFVGAGSGSADGAGTAAAFLCLSGIAAAPDGRLYLTDQFNANIRVVSRAGVVTTLAGKVPPGGPCACAPSVKPLGAPSAPPGAGKSRSHPATSASPGAGGVSTVSVRLLPLPAREPLK